MREQQSSAVVILLLVRKSKRRGELVGTQSFAVVISVFEHGRGTRARWGGRDWQSFATTTHVSSLEEKRTAVLFSLSLSLEKKQKEKMAVNCYGHFHRDKSKGGGGGGRENGSPLLSSNLLCML